MRFLQIPLNDEDRRSALATMLWGDKYEETAYIGLGFFDPIPERGGRALGIQGFANTLAAGGTMGQAVEYGLKDAWNSAAHPVVSGPMIQGTSVALTGKVPYISQVRDFKTGEFNPDAMTVVNKREPGWPQISENLTQGIFHTNSFVQNIAVSVGLIEEPEWMHRNEAVWLRSITDIVLPRFVKHSSDPDRRREKLQQEYDRATGDSDSLDGLLPKF